MHYKYLIIFVAFLSFISCKKDSPENNLPVINGNVGLNIISNYRKPSSTARFEPNYIFTEASIAIDQISFLKKETTSSKAHFEGPFICDLVNNTTEPQLPYGNIEEGNYQLFQLDILKELENNFAIDIKGNYHPNGVLIHPFHYSVSLEETVSIMETNGVNIVEDSLHQVAIVVDLAFIFDGIDFENVHYEEDGFLDFNAEKNQEHHLGITERFLEGFRVYQTK
ncbi:hypothetical protein [Flammeovirga aprica]|uniref:DUF4382 domain-containing protein n=1 Tax=Flammeovirga aprica JL-4 TaxID=694437 RepID=A0A7X9RVV4_9BACT|nr:hypothetical protein [Flammeovirga aprica]NME69638.1 hypothetical protein [Flammeovirga aprica JL-4]